MKDVTRMLRVSAMFAGLLVSGCIESPQHQAEYRAVAIGTGVSSVEVGNWTVTLARADVVFGPVYFCAAASGSSTLCRSSIAELASVTRFDALSQAATPIGNVHGFTGTIRSASYDFGISWFDTINAPLPAAEAPGSHSMQLEGEASRDGEIVPFSADIDVVPQYQGQHAIPTQPVSADIESSNTLLEVHFDVAAWLGQVDFETLTARPERPIAIKPGTLEHNEILVGIKNLSPPEFRWVARPQ